MKTFTLALAALLAAACGTTPKESFYTLSTDATPIAASASPQLAIFVGPVAIPEDVDRAPFIVRVGPNKVDLLEDHRWAEPLKSAIPRVLAEGLMRSLATPRVFASRQGANQSVDYRVAVEVRRFESSLETGASIDAVWTVTNAKGATRSGRSVLSEPASGRDLQSVAAAHSRALGRMAGEIAAGIRAFSPG